MPSIGIQIKNMPQIRAAFSKAPALTVRRVNEAIQKSAFLIERESKIRTPVDTGRLRASHETTYAPLKATIEPKATYAIYVHEGTRFMRGRQFLFNAVQSAEGQVQKFFTQAVQQVLDEIGKQT